MGEDVVNVTVILRDARARPVPHRAITIETSPAIDSYQPTAVTDNDGFLRATLKSEKPLTVRVSVIETSRQIFIMSTDLRFVPPVGQPREISGKIKSIISDDTEMQLMTTSLDSLSPITQEAPSALTQAPKKENAVGYDVLRWHRVIPVFLLIGGLILVGLIWCLAYDDGCGPCQFWKRCLQQPITAIKGPPNPILSLTIAGPTELSENGRYMITPMQAISPLFIKANRNLEGPWLSSPSNLISLETPLDVPENSILILPDSIETGSSSDVLTFQLLTPTELIGEDLLLTFGTGGYQAQMPLMLQSIPLAQINYPRSLSDITFNQDEQTIEIQVDGRILPVGLTGYWKFTLWDLTSGELLSGEHICHEMKGVCFIPYDYSHSCLAIDINLIGQMESGNVQAAEQFSECP